MVDSAHFHAAVRKTPEEHLNRQGARSLDSSASYFSRIQAASATASSTPKSATLSLREWIKQTSNSNNATISSPSYLQAALKITQELANQIIKAEKLERQYGISQKLDGIPISRGRDWAEYVYIRLVENGCSIVYVEEGRRDASTIGLSTHNIKKAIDCIGNEQLESFHGSGIEDDGRGQESSQYAHVSRHHGLQNNEDEHIASNTSNTESLNDQLTLFLESFGVDDFEKAEAAKHNCNNSNPITEQQTNTPPTSTNYVNIASAQIRCPESEQGILHDDDEATRSKQAKQRIFYLGLVLYELFSGGERPPDTLYSLAVSRGAFVSLSTLTLVNQKKCDDQMTDTYTQDSKRLQRPSGKDIGLCQVSCEYLRLIGVNGQLCNLILNLLNCVYGDLAGRDCCTDMTDVAHEVQLMIDRPSKFLQCLDMEKLSSSGLPLSDLSIPREQEFEAIKSCYHRCLSGSSEIAIIKGQSGLGKSFLAMNLGRYVITSEGGMFLMGKFDMMQQSRPFSALSEAFTQYVDILICQSEFDWARVVIDQLHSTLGRGLCDLFNVIPRLDQLVN
jgi:hypothetical protein